MLLWGGGKYLKYLKRRKKKFYHAEITIMVNVGCLFFLV